MTELKPYTGPHAGDLHHVVEDGEIKRNATPLEVEQQRTIAALEDQVKELQAHPDSWQSGFDAGRRTMHERSRHWKVWAENQIAKAVPEGHRVVPRHISNDAIERLGLMDNGNQPFFVINDRDDVKALYAAMVSQASKDKKPKPE